MRGRGRHVRDHRRPDRLGLAVGRTRGSRRVARMLTVAAPIAVGHLRAAPAAVRALRRAAGPRRLRVVPHDAGERRRRGALQRRAGRAAGWSSRCSIYLLLAFPTGRLERRARPGAGLGGGAARGDPLPADGTAGRAATRCPTPPTSCTAGCPENAFMVGGRSRRFIEDVVRPLREVITIALFAVVAVRLAQRHPRREPRSRAAPSRRCSPSRASAARPSAPRSWVVASRRTPASLEVVDVAARARRAAAGGRVPRRASCAGGCSSHARPSGSPRRLHAHPSPEDLRTALADAFDDPALEIRYWLGDGQGHWGDADGHPLDPPAAAAGRGRDRDRATASGSSRRSSTTPRCEDDRAFIDTATTYALMTLDNHRLSAQASVAAARGARVARAHPGRRGRRAPADRARPARRRAAAARRAAHQARARRRAHDGGHANGAEGAAVLRGLGGRGRGGARGGPVARARHLPGVARRSRPRRGAARGGAPQPASDHACSPPASGATRREIESAAYFCCLEALQNAAKHAEGASAAVSTCPTTTRSAMEVRDDGAGFDPPVRRAGSASRACATGWPRWAATWRSAPAPATGRA